VPEILFLDEPTTGLDPRGRNQVWDLVRRIAAGGTTVLLTTQYLDEADRLAERLAVIDHGRVIAEGTSRELKASIGANALHLRVASTEQGAAARAVVSQILGDRIMPGADPLTVAARLAAPGQAAEVMAALYAANVEVAEFSVGTPSLDEVFLALTGKPSAEPAEEAKP
jgi:ABC-2 type transport system ATP-binding protein